MNENSTACQYQVRRYAMKTPLFPINVFGFETLFYPVMLRSIFCKWQFAVAVVLVFFCSGFVSDAVAEQPRCLSHSELVALDLNVIPSLPTCDPLGSFFIRSFGVLRETDPDARDQGGNENYAYYFYFRLFLVLQIMEEEFGLSPDEKIEALSALLAGTSALANASRQSEDDQQRLDYYRAYSIFEFSILSNAESTLAPAFLVLHLDELLEDWKPITLPELQCFIRFDIPTLQISEIHQSANYQLCVQQI